MALARAVRTVKSVLFVCTGNICRSPIAEGLFRRLIGNRGDIDVVSAGVHAVRGQPPSLYAVQVCAEDATDISDVRSQPLTAALVDRATHIFAMTGAHLETIQTLFPQGAEKSFLLREFEEAGTTVWRDVPDPIGLGREVYEDCARIIKNALPSVLAFVEQSFLVPPGAARTGSVYHGDDIAYPMEPQRSTSSPRIYGEALRRTDPEIFNAIVAEEKRQRENIELIASENFTSRAVMEAQGSVLTNKYAEGYPRKRWYGGCENVDTAEQLAIDRAKRLFGCEHVNVQPHSGAQANMAVYFSMLKPGDKILAMNLAHGGHLTHGHPANFSGKFYAVSQYGVSEKNEQIDYDALQPQFRDYQRQVVVNAKALAAGIAKHGYRIVSGGTDNHLMLVDLRPKDLNGKEAQEVLDRAGITVNKNAIPFDTSSPFKPGGIRVGTPAVTTRGMKEEEMLEISDLVAEALTNRSDEAVLNRVREKVRELTHRFPLPS